MAKNNNDGVFYKQTITNKDLYGIIMEIKDNQKAMMEEFKDVKKEFNWYKRISKTVGALIIADIGFAIFGWMRPK